MTTNLSREYRYLTPHRLANLVRLVPEHMLSGLILYVEDGVLPGDFLTHILENDFVRAAGHADDTNQRYLFQYADALYNYLPSACWGSKAAVREWAQQRTDERLARSNTDAKEKTNS